MAAEEAETRVRPQLTMAARHLIRSTKDLSKWDENRQKRIAAQKERWEEKELEAMRDPLLCPQSRALCQKQSGTSRDADVVERLLGYGEEWLFPLECRLWVDDPPRSNPLARLMSRRAI